MTRTPSLLDAVDLLALGLTDRVKDLFTDVERQEPLVARGFWRAVVGENADLPLPERIQLVLDGDALMRAAMRLTERLPDAFEEAIEAWYVGDTEVCRPVLVAFQETAPERASRVFGVVVQQVASATTGDIVEQRDWTWDDAHLECLWLCQMLGAKTLADAVGFPAIERAAARLDDELLAGQSISDRTRELLEWAEKSDPARMSVVWASLLTVTYLARPDGMPTVPVLEHPRNLADLVAWVQSMTFNERLSKLSAWFVAEHLEPGFCTRTVELVRL